MNGYIESRRKIVDETLSLLSSELDDSLTSSGLYALSNGGKRLRPLICILSCEMLGGEWKATTSAFTALELIHNATLIHDDILDDDEYRRGKPSTPNKYGVKTAVITGDALLSLGLRYAASTGNTKIVEWLSDTSLKMVTGIKKQVDINGSLASPEKFLEVNYLKSGSLFEAAGALGALSVGATEEYVRKLAKFGRLFGDAYQIKDDIADTETNGESEPRSDLENGDMTLPIIYALQSKDISIDEREYLRNAKQNANGSIKKILLKSGAIDTCIDLMNGFLVEAKEILGEFPDSEAKDGLISLLDELG